jgi:phage terminase large subunit-like protein
VSLLKGHRSPAERLLKLPPADRKKVMRRLSDDEMEALLYDWKFWARPEQLPPAPETYTTFGIVAGRGSGKTRAAAEMVREEVASERSGRLILIGANAADVRDVIIEGESGILEISPPWDKPKWEPSKRRLTWKNGATALCVGAHDPDAFRGPQSDFFWADEIAKWQYAQEAWDNAVFGNRLGKHPRRVFTTTPKPIKLVRSLLGRDVPRDGETMGQRDPSIVLAPKMSTYDNLANLAASFVKDVFKKYQGTRLGRQELMGELLLDVPGALWTLDLIDVNRVSIEHCPRQADFTRIVVALDPAVTSGEESNETGIIVVGKTWNDHFYVLRDRSGRHTAFEWATIAVQEFLNQQADRIVAEVNNGGDLVGAQIRIVAPNVPYSDVHASRGKRTRGEPVAALYEQGRVHHVGAFDVLEDQMITWIPDAGEDSPDRADALVWGITELAGFGIETLLPGTSSERTSR